MNLAMSLLIGILSIATATMWFVAVALVSGGLPVPAVIQSSNGAGQLFVATGITPSWTPSSSITLTWRIRIWSLMRNGRAMAYLQKQRTAMPTASPLRHGPEPTGP